jgi:trans-aconitate 2-methyltransferase
MIAHLFKWNVSKYACIAIPFCLMAASLVLAIDSFDTYEKAEFYHDHSLQQWSVAYDALKEIPFKGHETILELGCRSGRISANLADRIPDGEVIATEMGNPGAIQFAKQNYTPSLYPNLSFLEQNFLDTDYNEYFDFVVSFSSLHWCSDQKAILEKVYKALKADGQILFTIPGRPLSEMNVIMMEIIQHSKWKIYFTDYTHPRKKMTSQEYESLLNEIGFKTVNVKEKRSKYFFENKRALINWFRAFSPILDFIPENNKEEFLIDFANTYTKFFHTRANGCIPFAQRELFINAVK